jgi:dihydrofolate reductase
MGHVLVMGRRTFESSGALPGRTTIVLTRQAGWRPPGDPAGVETAASLDRALERAAGLGETEVFICGGEEIYRRALAVADRLRITRVDTTPEGDTVFPEIDSSQWRRVSREEHAPDERNPLAYAFEVYERKSG